MNVCWQTIVGEKQGRVVGKERPLERDMPRAGRKKEKTEQHGRGWPPNAGHPLVPTRRG